MYRLESFWKSDSQLILSDAFRGFPRFIQANHDILPGVRHYCFLSNPFQFIIHPMIPDQVISLSSDRVVKYPQKKTSTLFHVTQCTTTELCYVWHSVHQYNFVTYDTMYTSGTLLRMTQCTPVALCYVWHSVHQYNFVTYDTMYTSSTLLRMTQCTLVALCYVWHSVHQ